MVWFELQKAGVWQCFLDCCSVIMVVIASFQARNLRELEKILKFLCITVRMNEAMWLLWLLGLELDRGTYALLLQKCIFRKIYKKGRRIHAQMDVCGCSLNMAVCGYALNEYLKTKIGDIVCQSGDLMIMHVFFSTLMDKSLISWNTQDSGYVQKELKKSDLIFITN
ncbi:hypothetical protein OIU79_013384 [Salix purpurea]|uniref:Uncharacterized protein n=1 Tax=Salix purpurea TaxID=77065 RepID=A0A9Q0Q5A5_SALPP|nr:hypothetical protein OIU79_013384 [Salix purpurea]